jgi:2'-5' RNA ligase
LGYQLPNYQITKLPNAIVMMRLFIGVGLSDDARAAIGVEQERLKRGLRKASGIVRWMRADQMHITRAFLGHVREEEAERVVRAAGRSFDQPAFDVDFGGLGMFPLRGAPGVLWLGVRVGEASLRTLQAAVAARLTDACVAFDAKPFHPHLTLARWRESGSADRRAIERLSVSDGGGPPEHVARVRVSAVVLYESRQASGPGTAGTGPTYTALVQAPLTC